MGGMGGALEIAAFDHVDRERERVDKTWCPGRCLIGQITGCVIWFRKKGDQVVAQKRGQPKFIFQC